MDGALSSAVRHAPVSSFPQEKRMSKATEVMMQYVENLKRTYEKDHAELMEFKKLANQNSSRSCGPSGKELGFCPGCEARSPMVFSPGHRDQHGFRACFYWRTLHLCSELLMGPSQQLLQ